MSPPAIVVQTVDYGEADRIVHVITERGRASWFAHAAKKSQRRFGGSLELFTTITPELEPKRRQGMAVLASATTLVPRLGLRLHLESMAMAAYAGEVTYLIAPEEADTTTLYQLLGALYDALAERAATPPMRRAFELAVLAELGVIADLGACTACDRPLGDDEESGLDLEAGGSFCLEHAGAKRRIGPKTRTWAERALAGQGARFDENFGLDPTWAKTAAERLGRHLDPAILAHVGAPLRSVAWLDETLML
ncbi:MAG: DNA repair protein RecO [Myxococcota bacterium]